MRCKSCGGHLSHLVTTVNGRRLYQCQTGMTVNGATDSDNPTERNILGIRQCGLVYDDRSLLSSGKYVYYSYHGDNKVPEAITTINGRIQ